MSAFPTREQVAAARRAEGMPRHEPERRRPSTNFGAADAARAARARRLLAWCATEFDCDEARLVGSEWAVARAMQVLAELEMGVLQPFKGSGGGA